MSSAWSNARAWIGQHSGTIDGHEVADVRSGRVGGTTWVAVLGCQNGRGDGVGEFPRAQVAQLRIDGQQMVKRGGARSRQPEDHDGGLNPGFGLAAMLAEPGLDGQRAAKPLLEERLDAGDGHGVTDVSLDHLDEPVQADVPRVVPELGQSRPCPGSIDQLHRRCDHKGTYARPMVERPEPTVDIRGHTDLSVDEITAKVPSSETYREGVSIWVWDEAGRWCLPRIGVEATGRTWTTSHETALCVAESPQDRLLLAFGDDPPLPVWRMRRGEHEPWGPTRCGSSA